MSNTKKIFYSLIGLAIHWGFFLWAAYLTFANTIPNLIWEFSEGSILLAGAWLFIGLPIFFVIFNGLGIFLRGCLLDYHGIETQKGDWTAFFPWTKTNYKFYITDPATELRRVYGLCYQNTDVGVNGTFEAFLVIGPLRSIFLNKDGKQDGTLMFRANYKDGEYDGLFEEFYENGQLKIRVNYIDGKEDGLYEEFDIDGNLTETETYRNGELVEENDNP